MSTIMDRAVGEARPTRRAIGWLLFLGPFFFASYGAANWLASTRTDVGAIVFGWESYIPFLAWTIVPYWSIDILYAVSLFVCATRSELNTHARRLLLVQVVAVLCFLVFPLRFTFERPVTEGLFGVMFDVLMGFDQPFNQAPSLHIALLIILWVLYARHIKGTMQWALHFWFTLILVSVLTTYQHHFIDIPTGVWLGWFCIWAIPEYGRSPLATAALTRNTQRRTIALRYAIGAIAFAIVGLYLGGWGLWLLWIASALLMVASIYAVLGSSGFQKDTRGAISTASSWLLAPYLAAAWVNSRLWTHRSPAPSEIVPGLWLGRLPGADKHRPPTMHAIVDLSAELPCRARVSRYVTIPMLDLVVPTIPDLKRAAQSIDATHNLGPTLVCCALGYSRSAIATAAWLLLTGRAVSPADAIECVRRVRPNIVLSADHMAALETFTVDRSVSAQT